MDGPFFSFKIFTLMGILCVIGTPVCAKLTPEHVVIVINRTVPESVALGEYYATQRGIPHRNIVSLSPPMRETISYETYQATLLHPLKEQLKHRQLASSTRVLVTTYGIPLRIKRPEASSTEQKWQADAQGWLVAATDFLRELRAEMTKLLEQKGSSDAEGKALPTGPSKRIPEKDQVAHQDFLLQQLSRDMRKARTLIRHIQDPDHKANQEKALLSLIRKFEGLSGVDSPATFPAGYSSSPHPTPQHVKRNLEDVSNVMTLIIQHPTDSNRNLAYKLAQQFFGIQGVIRLARQEIEQWAYKEAKASVDSELSLLWWAPDLYHISGKVPNQFYFWNPPGTDHPSHALPILMVGRIDAPTPALAKNMIDMAILAEQSGLSGKAYIDARGKNPGKPFSYGAYDQNLRDTADLIGAHTSYEVVLENTEKRFSHPGEAPNVGLYVGWYRYRSYEDAFTFNPGAIGYHIASGEARSLHNASEKGWCKNALERGITVTMGPTTEPYLDAFPLPTEFFGLLLTGHYSLVEAYYMTTRYLSWQMVLLGDPLYNPWKGKPLTSFESLATFVPRIHKLGELPTPPSELQFSDPTRTGKRIRAQREALLKRFSSY